MKVKTFEINEPQQNKKPFIRIFPNTGCGLEDCHCSDGWLLSVSNGTTGIMVTFDSEEEYKTFFNSTENAELTE